MKASETLYPQGTQCRTGDDVSRNAVAGGELDFQHGEGMVTVSWPACFERCARPVVHRERDPVGTSHGVNHNASTNPSPPSH